MNTPCVADGTAADELIRLVMDGMTSAGFKVSPPEDLESCRIVIAWPGARCVLVADDQGCAEWVYWPSSGADPKLTADLATSLLTGRPGPHPYLGSKYGEEGITFKGLVGLELRSRGLEVELKVFPHDEYFDVSTEIVAAAPGQEQGAKVCVTDDGCLTWIRDYWDEAATVPSEPEFRSRIADPAAVANAVVETITRAMSFLPPALA